VSEDYLRLRWRTGNHQGRTLYARTANGDEIIGMLDTPELAAEARDAHNERLARWEASRPDAGVEERYRKVALPANPAMVRLRYGAADEEITFELDGYAAPETADFVVVHVPESTREDDWVIHKFANGQVFSSVRTVPDLCTKLRVLFATRRGDRVLMSRELAERVVS
jgi:hypothetical protein